MRTTAPAARRWWCRCGERKPTGLTPVGFRLAYELLSFRQVAPPQGYTPMRFVYLLFLVALLAVIGIFAWQNREGVTVQFFDWRVAGPLSLIIAAVYILGMLSGSFLIGAMRRSYREVVDYRK